MPNSEAIIVELSAEKVITRRRRLLFLRAVENAAGALRRALRLVVRPVLHRDAVEKSEVWVRLRPLDIKR